MEEDPKLKHNHAVLKMHDPAAHKILFQSSICDVYEFDNASENWQQIDCKGTIFLYSRVSSDEFPYAVLVMNRNSAKDFSLGITPALWSLKLGRQPMEADLQDTTIMIQKDAEQIYGLWLFEEQNRQKLTNLIRWCITNGTT